MNKLFAGIALLAATAGVSNAAVIVSQTKTGTFNGFDEITLKVVELTGADGTTAGPGGARASVGTINVDLAAVAPAKLSIPGTAAQWKGKITNGGNGGNGVTPPATFFNLDTVVVATRSGPSSNTSTSDTAHFEMGILGGAEFRLAPIDLTPAGGASDDGIDQTLLGQVYVTAGGEFLPTGQAGTFAGVTNIVFLPIPEPASFGLIGAGALGLLARRRRA